MHSGGEGRPAVREIITPLPDTVWKCPADHSRICFAGEEGDEKVRGLWRGGGAPGGNSHHAAAA